MKMTQARCLTARHMLVMTLMSPRQPQATRAALSTIPDLAARARPASTVAHCAHLHHLVRGLACGITLGVHDQKKPASLAPELSWVWKISRRQDHTAHGDGGQSAKASRATLGYMDRVGAM